jgi:hypothetical protein
MKEKITRKGKLKKQQFHDINWTGEGEGWARFYMLAEL